MNSTNTTHCLLQCYDSDLTTAAYNFSINSLQCLADQATRSPEMNRTVWNIIWSSLTTIFACTWISCHPNFDFDKDMLMKMKQKWRERWEQEEWERREWEQRKREQDEREKREQEQREQEQREQEQREREQEVQWAELEQDGQEQEQEQKERKQKERAQEDQEQEELGQMLLGRDRRREQEHWEREREQEWGLQERKRRDWVRKRREQEQKQRENQMGLKTLWWFIKWCRPSNRMVTRVKIVLVALVAPEFIVMWALRQYMVARDIVKSCQGWTTTHAFFSLMGGFVITDKEQDPICTLVLIPHSEEAFRRELHLGCSHIESCFKIAILAKMSTEASTFNVDAAAETLVDILVGKIWEVVVGQGLLASGTLFQYETASQYLWLKALETINTVFDQLEMEPANDLASGSPSGLRRDLWDNHKDEIRATLRARIPNRLMDMYRNIQDTLVFCPKEEIEDKSKRDWLAKTFALAQTTWFVVQCIARRAQHLPLTEIELMTCAYAALSAVIYAFWWHKPFGVQFPIIIRTEIPHKREMDPTVEPNPWDITALAKFLAGSGYDEVNFQQRVRVPTFYSGYLRNPSSDFWNFIAEVTTAAAFGGIHLFAWNYQFPTRIELWLWRVSALVIVGIPPIAVMPISILSGSAALARHRSLRIISKFFLPILVLLYVIARLSILVLCLVALRRLPVGTRTNVNWLTFIPHID